MSNFNLTVIRECKETKETHFERMAFGMGNLYSNTGDNNDNPRLVYCGKGDSEEFEIKFQSTADLEAALEEIIVQFMQNRDNIVVRVPFTPEKAKK